MNEPEPIAQRQYTIHYRRGNAPLGQLEPNLNPKLIARREVAFSIVLMQNYPCFKQLIVQLDDELYMLTALAEGVTNERAFTFGPAQCVKLPEVR